MPKIVLRSFVPAIAVVIASLVVVPNASGQASAPISSVATGTASSAATDSSLLHMLVLGDSITWGQGLSVQDKFWWRVKSWLQQKTGREVKEKVKAHSGALIETTPGLQNLFTSDDGEVNLFTPTINEQIDDAKEFYQDTSMVDLIIVNGCINDVDVRNLLDASTSLDRLTESIREKCGARMHTLLRRVATEFPSAHVVVTGYYPIISPKTAINAFTRLLVKKLASQNPEARQMSDKEMREKLIAISEEWHRTSTRSLAEAVATTNLELQRNSSQQKILFAEIDFSPEHAFSAPDTLLWNFKFGSTNLSGLRKAIVVLTLGTAAYKTNDPLRESRTKSCKATYKKPKAETEKEKREREERFLACRYASLGHPNKMGALIYTEAIKGQLQWLISANAWLRKPAATQPFPTN